MGTHQRNVEGHGSKTTMTVLGVVTGLLCFALGAQKPSQHVGQEVEGKSHRDPKMYLPFIKVIIPPEPCGSESGTNAIRDGTCLPVGKCDIMNGQRNGNCAMGFGECCRLLVNCTADQPRVEINEYVTTLRTPEPSTSQCTFKIRKKKDVCQIRLDFKTFQSSSANTDGICDMDRITISNSITVADEFTTCGDLREQHMYLSFGSSDTIDITPRLITSSARYEIVMSQIPCLSNRIVPSYCLQYFNKTTDVVKSFDWPHQQQSTQQYTVCVESPEQSKSITWRTCSGSDGGGSVVGRPFYVTTSPIGTPDICNTDWVDVNGDFRHCGQNFPPMLRSTWKPYLLNVHFDNMEIPIPPFGPSPGFATNAGECSSIGASSGGLFVCAWHSDVIVLPNTTGSCQCDVNPALLIVPGFNPVALFGPPPDVNNTGFCLKYEI